MRAGILQHKNILARNIEFWIVDAILTVAGPAGFVAAKLGVTLLVVHEYAELSRDFVAVASGLTCAAALNNVHVGRRLAAERQQEP